MLGDARTAAVQTLKVLHIAKAVLIGLNQQRRLDEFCTSNISFPSTPKFTNSKRFLLQDQSQEHLVGKLTKNAGFGMGLEFRESANVLSADSQVPVRAGMVFNVSMGERPVSTLLRRNRIRTPCVTGTVCCG